MAEALDLEAGRRVAREYERRWGLSVLVCRLDGRAFDGDGDDGVEACAVRELAIREAARWGEPTFELSADDRLVWAVPLMHNAEVLGGLVSGVDTGGGLARIDVNRAAADLRERAEAANLTNAALLELRRHAEGHERHRAEAIHVLKQRPRYDLRAMYLLEEPSLAAAIRRGDRPDAREILNRLLVGIHAAAGDKLHAVKSFYLELVTTVCRTAVQAGGAPEELIEANLAGAARLAAITTETELAHWLREMLEHAMDTVVVARERDTARAIADAVEYLREHFAEDLSRDHVARGCHLSPAHFSRELKRHLGCTYTELLTRLRVDEAADRLRRTDKSVALVALECGFADQSYFTKVFSRATGLTPREYRAQRAGTSRPTA